MRKVQWATLMAKRAKLEEKIRGLDAEKDKLDELNDQIAKLITPEGIEEAKAKVLKLRVDLERAEATLSGLEAEVANRGESGSEE
jgi:hypothetical protein